MSINIYDGLSDLKKGQEKIMILLHEMKEGSRQEKIYDLADLQNVLNVSRRTIATWTKQGILPHTKVGNKIWVTEEKLREFLAQNEDYSIIKKGGYHGQK